MNQGVKLGIIIPITVIYVGIWLCAIFIVVGFFMPTPVAFFKSLNGTSPKHSSRDGISVDEMNMYDILDDD